MGSEQTIIPKLKISDVLGIRYEESSEFQQSIVSDAYKKAKEITQNILRSNEKRGNIEQTETNSGTEKRNYEQISNIIFFTGDRGSGKTSTMLSYMEFLKDYYRNLNKDNLWKDLQFKSKESLMFTGLEYIDASILDKKEDILSNVLSKMLKKWLDEEKRMQGGLIRGNDYAYSKRQLQLQFNRVYGYLKNLKDEKNIMDRDNDMFLDVLQDMSFTENLKSSLKDLIEKYLTIMDYRVSGHISQENHYLVISIDDLDMNIQNGFELLDQVKKYLMLPNVIVLISADYDQLEKICINHYLNEFNKIPLETHMTDIERLAREYLDKIIPAQRRISLVSDEKWKYLSNETVTILRNDDENEESGSIEKIVSGYIRRYLGFNISTNGKNIHYMAPRTLREVNSWFLNMKQLPEADKLGNIKWYRREEFSRLCTKYLDREDAEWLLELNVLEAKTQINEMYMKIQQKLKGSAEKNPEKIPELGDVLTGLGKLKGKSLSDIKFASVCSIYLSLAVAECLEEIRAENKGETGYLRLRNYFGSSVWGHRERDLVGAMKDSSYTGNQPTEQKYMKIARSEFFIGEKKIAAMLKDKTYSEDELKQCIDDNKNVIIAYFYLLLFYDLEGKNIIEHLKYDKEEKIIYVAEDKRATFAFSNFILNWYQRKKNWSLFKEKLIRLLYPKEIKSEDELEKISSQIKMEEIKEIKEALGDMTENIPLIPLQDMDYLWDTAQRIKKEMVVPLKIVGIADEDGIEQVLQNAITIIGKSLDDYEDSAYKNQWKSAYIVKMIENPENKYQDFWNIMTSAIIAQTPSMELHKMVDWGDISNG